MFTVTDSGGNSYQKAIQINNGSDDTLAIYYAQNIAGGTNTVTVSDGILGTMRFAILEYAGIAASSPLDVTVAAQGSGTNPSSGSVATTANGDLLLGAIATANSPGFSAGSGYTIEESVPAAPGTKLIAEDGVQAVAGSAASTATLLASDNWAAALAAFRPAQAPWSSPPTLAQPANQTSAENSSVSLQLVGSDPDGDTLTYSAAGLPSSLSLNAATGLISGTLPFGSAGTYTVTAAVSDGSQTSSSHLHLDGHQREPGSHRHESVLHRRTSGNTSDDQRHELRGGAGHQHGHVQWDGGHAHQLEPDQHRRPRAERSHNGPRRRDGQWHGEQWRPLHRHRCDDRDHADSTW